MGKRALEAFAGNKSWGFLERIDAELHAAVTAVYSSVLQFDGAFETMDEAADLVHELLPHRSARDVAEMSRSLGAWKSRGRLAPSMARQLSEGLPSMPRSVLRPRVDPGEAFTSLVESSPAIALEKLKKAIKARRASKVGREEREKESREKWGLELVSYIKEAGLPVPTGCSLWATTTTCGYTSLGIVGPRLFEIGRWPGAGSELGCRWLTVQCGLTMSQLS